MKISRQTVEIGSIYKSRLDVALAVNKRENILEIFCREPRTVPLSTTEIAVQAVAMKQAAKENGRRRVTLFEITRGLAKASNTFNSNPPRDGLVRVLGVSIVDREYVEFQTFDGNEEMVKARLSG
ncbi:MAG: hypothetical protein WAV41_01430 [Microgenomates group bacterium]